MCISNMCTYTSNPRLNALVTQYFKITIREFFNFLFFCYFNVVDSFLTFHDQVVDVQFEVVDLELLLSLWSNIS